MHHLITKHVHQSSCAPALMQEPAFPMGFSQQTVAPKYSRISPNDRVGYLLTSTYVCCQTVLHSSLSTRWVCGLPQAPDCPLIIDYQSQSPSTSTYMDQVPIHHHISDFYNNPVVFQHRSTNLPMGFFWSITSLKVGVHYSNTSTYVWWQTVYNQLKLAISAFHRPVTGP